MIGIIGLGYVGLPLAVEFCNQGFDVYGVDKSSEKIELLRNGQTYICLLYTSPSPRDGLLSRMPSSA